MALPGETLDLGMKNDTSYVMSDHNACYSRLGLTDTDLDEYRRQGRYYDYTEQTDVEKVGFYGRLKRQSDSRAKDEL